MDILAPNADERVKDVRVNDDTLTVDLMDGRTISVPLVWYPRLVTPPRSRGQTGKPLAPVTASIGPTLTKT